MLRVLVMVSGGGTNLQAILDAVSTQKITNTEIVGVISNNKNAYALERAKAFKIPTSCISPKDFDSREAFYENLLEAVDTYRMFLISLSSIELMRFLEANTLLS